MKKCNARLTPRSAVRCSKAKDHPSEVHRARARYGGLLTWTEELGRVTVIENNPYIDAKEFVKGLDNFCIEPPKHLIVDGRVRYFDADEFCAEVGVPTANVLGDAYFNTPIETVKRKGER